MGKWEDKAMKVRPMVEKAAETLSDADASKAPSLFPGMSCDGALIKSGTRIHWHGQLKRAAVDLWDLESNNPANAPALWEDVAYKDGWRIIPEAITATLAFVYGELGWWHGTLYRSLRDGNTFNPSVTPEWWEAV